MYSTCDCSQGAAVKKRKEETLTSYLVAGSDRRETCPQTIMAGLLKKVRVEVMGCFNDGRKRGDQCRTNSVLFVPHCIYVVDLNGHGFPCAVCQLTLAHTCFANLAR